MDAISITQPTGHFDTDSGLWMLTEPWSVLTRFGKLHIKPGYKSDGASVPRIFWIALGPRFDSPTFPCSFGHDAFCDSALVKRSDADEVFLDHLLIMGPKAIQYKTPADKCRWYTRTMDSLRTVRSFEAEKAWKAKAYIYYGGVRAWGEIASRRLKQSRIDAARQFISLNEDFT